MDARLRARIAAGLLLILFGAWLLVIQFLPEPARGRLFSWPLIIISIGLFFLFLGLLSHEAGLAVPACVIGGIGGILYVQHIFDAWGSWAYAWALIPGFVGVGLLLTNIFGERSWDRLQGGGWLILISLALFIVFGSFLGPFPWLFLPVILIVVGAFILLRPLFQRR